MVKLVTAEHRLKGDRNAYEEICADSTGTVFSGRIGSRIWRLRFDHTCASAVCNPRPPPPPPVFNPSSPNTVPQPSYKPLTPSTPSTSPSTPSTVPSGEVTSPANEEPPRTTARSHRRASVATEVTSPANEEPPRTTARSHRRASVANAGSIYRAGPIVIGPPPVAYSYIGYGYPCAWQRSWDGYWFRRSPCSW